MSEELLVKIHQVANEVEDELALYLTESELEMMDCDDLLQAGKDFLGQDNQNVNLLESLIKEYDAIQNLALARMLVNLKTK